MDKEKEPRKTEGLKRSKSSPVGKLRNLERGLSAKTLLVNPKKLTESIFLSMSKHRRSKSSNTKQPEDFGLKKFKTMRAKSASYLKNPPRGNLGLYMKSTRMNVLVGNQQNNFVKRSKTSNFNPNKSTNLDAFEGTESVMAKF